MNQENDITLNTKQENAVKKNSVMNIVGYDESKVKKRKTSNLKRDTKIAQVILVIGKNVSKNQEFITGPINQILKNEGFRYSDISGNLYSLKGRGYLTNRPTTSNEEIEAFGKSSKIWSTTPLFWEHFTILNHSIKEQDDDRRQESLCKILDLVKTDNVDEKSSEEKGGSSSRGTKEILPTTRRGTGTEQPLRRSRRQRKDQDSH